MNLKASIAKESHLLTEAFCDLATDVKDIILGIGSLIFLVAYLAFCVAFVIGVFYVASIALRAIF